MARKLSITVDKALCMGNLRCIATAPGVFREDSDGQSEVFDVDGASEEAILDAAFDCPASAISVTDAESGVNLLL